jgi:hypothetical protein
MRFVQPLEPRQLLATGTIASSIRVDANGNGQFDLTDAGSLPGMTVFLDANNNGRVDGTERRTTSAANGAYRFANVPTGAHLVRIVLPTGWRQTIPAVGEGRFATVSANQTWTTSLFGTTNMPTGGGTIRGTVFTDLDADGAIDAGEPLDATGAARVYLDANNNAKLDAGERTARADSGGRYVIDGLAQGAYVVRHVAPAGMTRSTPRAADAAHRVWLSPTRVTASNLNFGYYRNTAAVTGEVYDDANNNGKRDATERRIAGARAYVDRNQNGLRDATEPFFTTGAAGVYFLLNLPPGTFTIRVEPPTGYRALGTGVRVTLKMDNTAEDVDLRVRRA